MEHVATFSTASSTAARALNRLDKAGLVPGSPIKIERRLLDTFDGRLHSKGLRLEYRKSTLHELFLVDDASVAARVELPVPFTGLDDLTAGPFRCRIADVVGERSLMVMVALRPRVSRAIASDKRNKMLLTAWVFDQMQIIGHPDTDAPVCIVELYAAGPRVRTKAVRRAFTRNGWRAVDGDALAGAATVAGIDLAGFRSRPKVAITTSDRTIDGVVAVFKELACAVDATWQGTLDETDTEFLHDFRVAIRRTRAVLANTKQVLPPVVHGRASTLFASLGHGTSEARDLDVQLHDWDDSKTADSVLSWDLAPVRTRLEERGRVAHEELDQLLKSMEVRDEMAWWTSWLDEPVPGDGYGPRAKDPLGRFVAKRIARAQKKLVKQGRNITDDTPNEQVHELRKEAKKVRYLFECFGDLMPKARRKVFVKQLKALQDNLGTSQDAYAQNRQLTALAGELQDEGVSADTVAAMGRLCAQLDRRRLQARAEFGERFAAYDSAANRQLLDELLGGLGR